MSRVQGFHEEFVAIPGLGNASLQAFPDKCEHDDNLIVYTLANGDALFERDYRCPTDEATYEYVAKVAAERNTHIEGQTCGCSKCGKVLSLQEMMGDSYWL